MRFCERVRRTAAALISSALADASATITADVTDHGDTPVSAGATSHVLIRADDKKSAIGTPNSWRTDVALEIALRVSGISAQNAQSRTDALTELIETTLLGGNGWSLNLTTAAGSTTATPSDMSGLAIGMGISGTGLGNDNYITALDTDACTIALATAAVKDGTYAMVAGSFVDMFEGLDAMDSTSDDEGKAGAYHIWCADLTLSGHVTESFARTATTNLTGVSISITASAAAYGSEDTSDPLETEFISED